MKRRILQQRNVFERITKIIKYNEISMIDIQRIRTLESKFNSLYDLDQNLLLDLQDNPYFYYQYVTDYLYKYYDDKYGLKIKSEYIGINNESNNIQYSEGIIVVDDNFNRLLICVCILSVHIIYGELGEQKYDLIEQLKEAVNRVILKEEDYFGENIYDNDWIDESLLMTSNQLYWGIIHFILGHEIAHSLLESQNLDLIEEEKLCDRYAFGLITEMIYGNRLKENCRLHPLLLYSPGVFFLISNYSEYLRMVEVQNKAHLNSLDRAEECLKYMSKYKNEAGVDCYKAHMYLFEFLME